MGGLTGPTDDDADETNGAPRSPARPAARPISFERFCDEIVRHYAAGGSTDLGGQLMRGKSVLMTVMLMAAWGCGGMMERAEPVELDLVPPEVRAAATKALPGIRFDGAQKIKVKGQQAYEVRGKDKRGEIQKVDVSADGKVLEVK